MKIASDIFEVKIFQQPNCAYGCYMPNYIVIMGTTWKEYKYTLLPYSTLLNVVNNATQYLLPLKFNQRFNRIKNINGCASHVIYCLFPYQCILSSKTDPLLLRIQLLYYRLLKNFWNSLPGTQKPSISLLKNTTPFGINVPYCYNFARCYGIDPTSTSYLFAVDLSLSAMENAHTALLKLPDFDVFKNRIPCDPFVFICYISGLCNVFFRSELNNELSRGATYIFGNNVALSKTFKSEQTSYINKLSEQFKNRTSCGYIYIYGDQRGRFHIRLAQYEGLLTFLNKYNEVFRSLFYNLADSIMAVQESEFHSSRTPQLKFNIQITNTMVNDSLNVNKIEHFIKQINLRLTYPKKKISSKIERIARDLKSTTINVTELESNSMLTFEQIFNQKLEQDCGGDNSTIHNYMQTASINVWSLIIVVSCALLVIIAVWQSFIYESNTPGILSST